MRRLIIPVLLMSLALPLKLGWAYSTSTVNGQDEAQFRSTILLKKYMQQFGSLVAGMEILRSKEKSPDWEAIGLTVGQLEKTLKEMQAADKAKNYKQFTDLLENNLQEVKAYGQKKDKRVFDSFEKLTETCFKCHAQHRPSDFLIPKEKQPRISWLFVN
jgi:cytochrome c556